MQPILTVPNDTMALLASEEDDLASRSSARLLITDAALGKAETRARRIHRLGPYSNGPFVRVDASSFPIDEGLLRPMCVDLLDRAAGGTLFIDAVDTMPTTVQGVIIELIDELEPPRDTSRAVRLVSSTTASLLECVAARSFAEGLFYRLNIIHLVDPNGAAVTSA